MNLWVRFKLMTKRNSYSSYCFVSALSITWSSINHLLRPWCWGRWEQEKGTTLDEMVGWHHRPNGHEFEQMPGDSEGQGSLVCCNPRSRKESDISYQLNNSLLRREMNPPNAWTLNRFLSIKIWIEFSLPWICAETTSVEKTGQCVSSCGVLNG